MGEGLAEPEDSLLEVERRDFLFEPEWLARYRFNHPAPACASCEVVGRLPG